VSDPLGIRLDSCAALVTGSARGIGAGIAVRLAALGARLFVADVLEAPARTVVEAIRERGGRADFLALDVADESSWQEAADAVRAAEGALDILVNNAGIYLAKPTAETALGDFQRIVSVNLAGVFLGTKHCLDLLIEGGGRRSGGASIVNLSSAAGLIGSRVAPVYSMTKGGVRLLTKSHALEFARRGIRVNSVHPGLIDTEMGAEALRGRSPEGDREQLERAREAASRGHPIGRLGTASDIAGAVAFLASDAAAFVTGIELPVDGGVTAQ